jgi:hypothetical protein
VVLLSKGQNEAELFRRYVSSSPSYGKKICGFAIRGLAHLRNLRICDLRINQQILRTCDLRNGTPEIFRICDSPRICGFANYGQKKISLPTSAKSMTEHLKAMHGHVEEVRGVRMLAGAPVLG